MGSEAQPQSSLGRPQGDGMWGWRLARRSRTGGVGLGSPKPGLRGSSTVTHGWRRAAGNEVTSLLPEHTQTASPSPYRIGQAGATILEGSGSGHHAQDAGGGGRAGYPCMRECVAHGGWVGSNHCHWGPTPSSAQFISAWGRLRRVCKGKQALHPLQPNCAPVHFHSLQPWLGPGWSCSPCATLAYHSRPKNKKGACGFPPALSLLQPLIWELSGKYASTLQKLVSTSLPSPGHPTCPCCPWQAMTQPQSTRCPYLGQPVPPKWGREEGRKHCWDSCRLNRINWQARYIL